jgi:hypothetical protein
MIHEFMMSFEIGRQLTWYGAVITTRGGDGSSPQSKTPMPKGAVNAFALLAFDVGRSMFVVRRLFVFA